MQDEKISRAEKIEIARRAAGRNYAGKRSYQNKMGRTEDSGKANSGESIPAENYFFLRVLLSGFLLLAVMGVTRFDAMGEKQAEKYQVKIVKALKTQTGVEKIKEMLKVK